MADITIHGADGNVVEVIDGHLSVIADVESEFEQVSERDSLSFTWTAVTADPGTGGDTVLLVQNISSTLLLHIEDVVFSSDVATEIDIHLTDKAALTHSGTNVVPICLNQASLRDGTTLSTATADEANNVQGNIVDTQQVGVDDPYIRSFGGALILGQNGIVAVDVTADTTGVSCSISGYYKET